jgi:hypothetical protein
LFNRAKHLFDSAKGRAGLTVAPDEKGPALLAGPSRDRSCSVQLPRKTAHRIFAGERWTTLHGVNADFCQALAPLGEFFAGSKISRLIWGKWQRSFDQAGTRLGVELFRW